MLDFVTMRQMPIAGSAETRSRQGGSLPIREKGITTTKVLSKVIGCDYRQSAEKPVNVTMTPSKRLHWRSRFFFVKAGRPLAFLNKRLSYLWYFLQKIFFHDLCPRVITRYSHTIWTGVYAKIQPVSHLSGFLWRSEIIIIN